MGQEIEQSIKSKKEARLEKKRLRSLEKTKDSNENSIEEDDSSNKKIKKEKKSKKSASVKVEENDQSDDSEAPEEYSTVASSDKSSKKRSKEGTLKNEDSSQKQATESFDFVEAGYTFAPVSAKAKKEKEVEDDGLKIIEPKTNKRKLTVDDITAIDKEREEKAKKREALEPRSQFAVWVGNLRFFTTEESLREFFSSCGVITRIHLPVSFGKNRGFAYVDFETEEMAERACALSEQSLDGRNLLIKNAKNFKKDGQKPPPKKALPGETEMTPFPSLFIGNLTYATTKEDISSRFSKFGEIKKVRISTFEDSGRCKGYAWVDFKTQEAATLALRSTQKLHVDGRLIKVQYANENSVTRGFNLPQDHPSLKKKSRHQESESNPNRISIDVHKSNPNKVLFD